MVGCLCRGENGEVGVLHAFCPHLGTHLGAGTVKKNNLVCPYHSWEFDSSGKNKCIPYCHKDMSESTRVNAKRFHCRERLGMIFMWYHSEDILPYSKPRDAIRTDKGLDKRGSFGMETVVPDYELTILDEVENTRDYKFIDAVPFQDFAMHIMEPSQNSADWYHFKTVHQWLGQDDTDSIKFLHLGHSITPLYGTKPGSKDDEGKALLAQCLYIDEELMHMRIFNIIPLPEFFCRAMKTQVGRLLPV
jgi:phenylpropionate dioxygenase-like ring-hydroxylating dioxygenase large terminal subunit